MKFQITFAVAAAFLATLTSDAFSSPRVTPLSPGVGNTVAHNTADNAMSAYERALKAAFEQASANAVPTTENQEQQILQQQPSTTTAAAATTTQQPSLESTTALEKTQAMVDANTVLLGQVQQQEQAIDQYEAALEAAIQSSSVVDTTNSAPSTIAFGDEVQPDSQAAAPQQQPDWANISKDISAKIEIAESKIGGPLDAAKKGEIVGTVLAGSAVLGTVAINSPLLMGAALGYAGTHVFGGERGEALAESSKETLANAYAFTKEQFKEEKGDISRAGARIVEHLQNEALGKAREVKQSAEIQAHQVTRELSSAPAHMMEDAKKIIESDDFQQMPKRTFKAFTTFLGSDEVKRARERVAQSIKEGFESEEIQAVKARATRSLKDM